MTQPPDFEARLSRAETDAAAGRHLAAAHGRELSDLGVKVDANRKAINALGEQTRAQFDRVNERFDRLETEVRTGFAELRAGHDELRAAMRHGFDQSAAGFARIAALIDAQDSGDDDR